MSVTRPLSRSFATTKIRLLRTPRRFLHSSARRRQDDVNPENQDSLPPERPAKLDKDGKPINAKKAFPAYTKKQWKKLENKYTPEQMEAIKAGEDAIDPQDILDQGVLRRGPMTLDYVDDFAKIQPVIDKQPKAPEVYDPELRFKTEDELTQDLTNWAQTLPKDADPVEWTKFVDNTRLTVGKPEAELNPRDYEAPALPKIKDPLIEQQARASKGSRSEDEMMQYYVRLEKVTGWKIRDMKDLRIKTMIIKRVVNQTRMGKIGSMYYLTVAGNRKGLLGIGESKGREPEDARRQSVMNAIRNLTPIRRYEDRTIYGDVKGKMGATELELFTRPPGFGIRCQDKIYEMCKCAGISDLAARVTRARNPMNIIKATFQALLSQRDPEQIARGRGRKLVDLRKVYYAGNV